MKYFSMFTGVGGFELGIDKRGECVGFSEIDKYCNQLLSVKYPNVKNYGDATKIDTRQLPDFDLLVGGFPCQSFSIAGKRRGFDDTRGTLFFDVARILADKKPRYVVLENVKGLLSHDGGRTFTTIIRVLSDLGYFVEWQVLNSKNFGVPQNRERVFIIGHIRGQPRQKVFPITESNSENNKTQRKSNYTRTITTAHAHGSSTNMSYIKQLNNPTHSNDRVYASDGISPTLNTMQGGRRQPKVFPLTGNNGQTLNYVGAIMSDQNQKWLEDGKSFSRNFPQGQRVYDSSGISTTIAAQAGGLGAKTGLYAVPVLTPDRLEKRQNGRRFKKDGEPAFTLTKQDIHGVSDGVKIRRLTPLECERLQGFPDNWTKDFSDTQRYKMMGNAVTVNVVEYVMSKLLKQ